MKGKQIMRKLFNKIKEAAQATKEKFRNFKSAVCRKINAAREAGRMVVIEFMIRTNSLLAASRGENFVDSGIKILIAVVIDALLLAGLYALFGETIMPTVPEKVKDMFNFKG